MTKYTADAHALPYPEGVDKVAVHSDIQALATKTGVAISTEGGRAESAAKDYASAELTKDRTRLGTLETTAIPKALADAKTYADVELAKDRLRLTQTEAAATRQQGSITTLDERSFAQGRSITTLDQRSITQGERVAAIETVAIPKVLTDAKTYADTEVTKDRTRLTGLETVTVPKVLTDAKSYADVEVTKDRARLAQTEAADLKQSADIRETLRAALAYADAKAADINKAIDTSHVALDTDGTPYFSPGSTTVKVQMDTDGTPFYKAA